MKVLHPGFLFLAEVYWELEERLQSLGFDYTYDKHLYDDLVHRNLAGVQRRLLELPNKFLAASAHFLENHDEPRVTTLLSLPEHRAAALTILGLPGMRVLHEGQLLGTHFLHSGSFSRPVLVRFSAGYRVERTVCQTLFRGQSCFRVVSRIREEKET